jgi:orotidine-5'-phosphate decarboxylase
VSHAPTAIERLCFPLDYPTLDDALRAAESLAGDVGVFKIGLELFLREGPNAVREIARFGRPIFLDLKLHDIPATVAGAVVSVAALGAKYLTVHTSGGAPMLEAAVRAADGRLQLLGVTVLTSLDTAELQRVGIAQPAEQQVRTLGALAVAAGLDGLVCSVGDLSGLRGLAVGRGSTTAPLTLVTPGIRPAGSGPGDQKRVGTPACAIAAGSDLLVVGRPIRDAAEPVVAARAICAEIDAALRDAT